MSNLKTLITARQRRNAATRIEIDSIRLFDVELAWELTDLLDEQDYEDYLTKKKYQL